MCFAGYFLNVSFNRIVTVVPVYNYLSTENSSIYSDGIASAITGTSTKNRRHYEGRPNMFPPLLLF